MLLNHIPSGTGYWIRYTLESPLPGHGDAYAQLWFAFFDVRQPARNFAINKKFPLSELKPGAQVQGVTIAELGNRNRPLDMFVYSKGGSDYILMANSARGVMKITTEGIARSEGIEEKISGTSGQTYDTIEELKGVVQLDRLNADNALVMVETEDGSYLKTVALP